MDKPIKTHPIHSIRTLTDHNYQWLLNGSGDSTQWMEKTIKSPTCITDSRMVRFTIPEPPPDGAPGCPGALASARRSSEPQGIEKQWSHSLQLHGHKILVSNMYAYMRVGMCVCVSKKNIYIYIQTYNIYIYYIYTIIYLFFYIFNLVINYSWTSSPKRQHRADYSKFFGPPTAMTCWRRSFIRSECTLFSIWSRSSSPRWSGDPVIHGRFAWHGRKFPVCSWIFLGAFMMFDDVFFILEAWDDTGPMIEVF